MVSSRSVTNPYCFCIVGWERALHVRAGRAGAGDVGGERGLADGGGGDAAVPVEDAVVARQGSHPRRKQDGSGQDQECQHCR